MDIDIAKEFGAEEIIATQRLTLYLPNKDKDDNEVKNLDKWIKEARELLSRIGGGSTAYPPADGTWVTETGTLLWEQTKIVYSFVFPDKFLANIKNLKEFLQRFGRETNQGEVVVEFDGRFYRIKAFTP